MWKLSQELYGPTLKRYLFQIQKGGVVVLFVYCVILSLILPGIIMSAPFKALFQQPVDSELYRNHYIHPDSIQISSEHPKNLIVILLESMETNFAQYTPEIISLEKQHTNFAPGGESVSGTSWTIAGITGKLCGIPLNMPMGIGEYLGKLPTYLPGAQCLMNVLADKDYTIDDVKAACQEWKTEIGKKESDLTDECSQLTEIRKSYEGVDGRRIELKSAVDGADEESKRANGQLIAARAKVEELKKRQNEFASEQAAKEALELVKFANADVEKRYQEALAKSTAAKQTLSETNAKIDGIKETRKPKLEKEREERRKNYQKALAEKGILEETWKRAVGEYAKEKAQELRDSVDKRAQKRALAQGRRDAAKSVIGDNPRPNIEELRERQRVAEEASAAAEKRRQAASNLAGGNASAYAMLVKKMEERGSLSEEYSRIESLYTKLSGKTTGAGKSTGERMDVETFVQRYYLGMALYSANKRFSKMSGGQYELRLRKLDQQSGGAKDRGLDLMVYSNVTGKSREASTLSGGESFIAALALAMGMADQIQEKSSAINLDVMFIDEGFGSLDDHSRAQAVGALKQIADGSKLIGVISHVNELKREIDSQLVVTKGTDGSHAEWRLC